MRLVLFYHGPFKEHAARNVQTLCLDHLEKGVKSLSVCISSIGGDVNAGLGLYNFLRMLPIEVHTHNYGLCTSIAATVFLAGSTRTAESNSVFSMHAATYSEGPRLGEVAENTDLISEPFRSVAGWTEDRIKEVFSTASDTRIMASDAHSHGLISEIRSFKLESSDIAIVVRID